MMRTRSQARRADDDTPKPRSRRGRLRRQEGCEGHERDQDGAETPPAADQENRAVKANQETGEKAQLLCKRSSAPYTPKVHGEVLHQSPQQIISSVLRSHAHRSPAETLEAAADASSRVLKAIEALGKPKTTSKTTPNTGSNITLQQATNTGNVKQQRGSAMFKAWLGLTVLVAFLVAVTTTSTSFSSVSLGLQRMVSSRTVDSVVLSVKLAWTWVGESCEAAWRGAVAVHGAMAQRTAAFASEAIDRLLAL